VGWLISWLLTSGPVCGERAVLERATYSESEHDRTWQRIVDRLERDEAAAQSRLPDRTVSAMAGDERSGVAVHEEPKGPNRLKFVISPLPTELVLELAGDQHRESAPGT
jgi:hypothetical protein